MNTSSLNRSIGLALSALQQARAFGYSSQSISFIRKAIRLLNKARALLKAGNVTWARYWASCALSDVRFAILAR